MKLEGWVGLAPFDHEVIKEINELWKEMAELKLKLSLLEKK